MKPYKATVLWHSDGAAFTRNRYSRSHTWQFDGGLEVSASASPHVVPEPYVDPTAVDPEEAFIASLSSCHMLWFLSLAAKDDYVVESYKDNAEGVMGKNDDGQLAITKVTLQPEVSFKKGDTPSEAIFDDLHHEAHKKCFIANSVKTKVQVEAILRVT